MKENKLNTFTTILTIVNLFAVIMLLWLSIDNMILNANNKNRIEEVSTTIDTIDTEKYIDPLGQIQSELNGIKSDVSDIENRISVLETTEEIIDETTEKDEPEVEVENTNTPVASVNTDESKVYVQNTENCLTSYGGVYYNENGNKETYYNLNMNGVVDRAQSSGIPGDYWVRDDGVKMYGDYVIVAADFNTYPMGSTVSTSLGEGIVLDTGSFATSNPTQFDIATDW